MTTLARILREAAEGSADVGAYDDGVPLSAAERAAIRRLLVLR